MSEDKISMRQKQDFRDETIHMIALPDQNGRVDQAWLKRQLSNHHALVEYRLTRRMARWGWADLLEVAHEIGGQSGLLFIRSGIRLPQHWSARLTASLGHDGELPRIPAGNYNDAVNPLAGIPARFADEAIDGWLWLCSEHVATPVNGFPTDCVYIPPGAIDKLDTESPALLLDSLYALDPSRPVDIGRLEQPEILSAFGSTRARLRALAAEQPSSLPPEVGLDDQTVTLHITHSWGGGVARWIADIIDADRSGHHLVLASHGNPNGVIHGETLQLYALGPAEGLIREIPLRPAIADSEISHLGYSDLLEKLLDRFTVSRILVSSLIGHSLDVLNTKRPTALMLHDYYPAWPMLHLDPLDWQKDNTEIDLEAALTEHGASIPFLGHRSRYWQQLRDQWLQHVKKNRIVLFAPTRETLKRWQLLVSDPLQKTVITGHGFSGWPQPSPPVIGRGHDDGRLNVVIPGRLSAGKGLKLLESTIDELTKLAHLTLLGCGRNGWRFYGKSGIDIVAEYERDQLPKLLHQLAPQAALFLSTVPETWNYALSETRSLGIPAIATRLGSFIERIEPGKDGWLFDPLPEKLLDLIKELRANPEQLIEAAKHQPQQSSVDTSLKEYWKAIPAKSVPTPSPRPSDPLLAEAEANSAKLAQCELQAESLALEIESIKNELDKRTAWAIRCERLAGARTRWGQSLERDLNSERGHLKGLQDQLKERTKWAKTLDQEVATHRLRIKELDRQLDERTQWAKSLDQEIVAHRKCIADLESQLEERTQWAKSLDQEIVAHRKCIADLESQLEERTQWAQALDQETRSQRQRIGNLESRLEEEIRIAKTLEKQLRDIEQQLQHETEMLAQAQTIIEQANMEITHLKQDLHATENREAYYVNELSIIRASRSWRLTKPLRFFNRVLAEIKKRRAWNPLLWPHLLGQLVHSLLLHGLKNTLQIAQGASLGSQERPALPQVETPTELEHHEPVSLPRSQQPRASIVIPVYNNVAYTAACLRSIALEAGKLPFEVIVVDDCSGDATPQFLANCSGAEVLRNTVNSGFIETCNVGARRARGEYLVFLNNDTTVTQGWLEALLQTFDTFPSAGVVGARLVYPDGRLQEAGGIIFSDASGWNYGRNQSPDEPQYNFAAEADYVSGACLAIPQKLFAELGGFDRHYAPAYYEDTDLCFRVRQRGLQVICQPACTIVHHEGVSSGTDESSGTKRYQVVNREKFLQRWEDALKLQPPHFIDSESPDPVRRARFHRTRGRALIIDATTPMPDHDSGSVRFAAILELMVEQGWLVTFMPQNLQWEGRYSMALQQHGIEVLSAPAVTSLEPWLQANGEDLDLILVSRHYILEPILCMLRRLCPKARIVFDTVDLHFLREQRQAELSGSAAMKAAAERTRRTELALMQACDISLVVSPVEQLLLAELVPEADVRILSNIHSIPGRQQGWAQRRDLMFIGGFQHPPNVDAAEWLIDDLFPLIRAELPAVRLHIIGSRMPDALRSKAADGVIMQGFVEDLTPFLNGCRLSLAPLRYGAGVKGKVNQAMAWGLPVVATRCASEGMFLEHGQDILVADDPKDFAGEVVRAYRDEALWLKLSEGGLGNVERYFSRAAAGKAVAELLASARSAESA